MKKSSPKTKKTAKKAAKIIKMTVYDPAKIEKKWQKQWAASKLFKSKEDHKKPKYYVLDMFPYPSGEGLHVGHPKGYIATDIVSRFKRMNGYSVLHPMGFDAFGLPAENYALKTKTNPADAMKKTVARFKKQLEILGFDYDWSREVNTTDPKYYKWTQWIFLQLLKKGLAHESYEPINWCPVDKTGLANEDIENGRCERCGALVEKKLMKQWVLDITKYADRLLDDLDIVDRSSVPLFVTTDGEDAVRDSLPYTERKVVMCIVKHWKEEKFLCLKWKRLDWKGFVLGGIEQGEKAEDAAVREVAEETGYTNAKFVKVLGEVDSKFYQAVKKVNRYAHFTVVYLELVDGQQKDTDQAEKDLHDVVWIGKDEVADYINRRDLKYAWDLHTGKQKQDRKPLLDWPESIKTLQKNWIGRSEGASIKFKVQIPNDKNTDAGKNEAGKVGTLKGDAGKIGGEIEVFTTRPDTVFGVTYVVLAPEHKLVSEFLNVVGNRKEVEDYIAKTKAVSEIERTDAGKEKTGVELKGVKVVNPANGAEVPLWIADYVLPDYGTGAVMAVPAHDERDWAFAKKFGLEVKQVIAPFFTAMTGPDAPRADKKDSYRRNVLGIVKHWSENKYIALNWKQTGWHSFVVGGVEQGESDEKACEREIIEETGYKNLGFIRKVGPEVHTYHFTPHKDQNRYGYCQALYFELKNDDRDEMATEESGKHEVKWIDAGEMPKYLNLENNLYYWNVFQNGERSFTDEGKLINSAKFDGHDSATVKKEITIAVGGQWVTKYKLRDWVFSRQRYWGEPIPVIHCENCKLINPESGGIVPVPEKDLPVVLPKVKFYEPTGTGESPLAAIEKWVNVKCPVCKGKAKMETNTMPQWAGSSWYYLRYEDPDNKKALVDPKKEKYWSPVDLYVGGAEHATRHLIYARFWHKFLYDIGAVSTIEPFLKLQHVGLIMGEDGRKMSKRFGNVVNPDDVAGTFGADALRLYEMFMGPFDQQIAWSTASIVGTRRFIERVWKLREKIVPIKLTRKDQAGAAVSDPDIAALSLEGAAKNAKACDKILHKAIKKVTDDIENLRFNTAISSLMIAVNDFEKIPAMSLDHYESLLKLLAPFVPHVTEELWEILGNEKSIHVSSWPRYDAALAVDDEVTIMVQVNGKVRGSFKIGADAKNEEIEKIARELPEAKKWAEGKTVRKVIVVPKKLVNIVVN